MMRLNLTSKTSRQDSNPRDRCSFLYSALVAIISAGLLAVPIAKGDDGPEKTAARIAAITPNPAPVGGTVQIQLVGTDQLPKYLLERKPSVYFGGESAEVTNVSDSTITVFVPPGINTNPVVDVLVGALKMDFQRFRVVPRIIEARPSTAAAGSQITLIPDVALGGADIIEVLLYSRPLDIVEIGTQSIVVTLPESVAGASPDLTLSVDGVSGKPFLGLLIDSTTERAFYRFPSEPLTIALSVAGLMIFFAVTGGYLRKRLFRATEKIRVDTTLQQPTPPAQQSTRHSGPPIPEVPDELAELIASRECVLFAGGGISAAAGFPTWEVGLKNLLQRATETQLDTALEPEFLDSLTTATPFEALELLLYRFGSDFVYSFIQDVYGQDVRKLPKLASTISTFPFAGVITTNWDDVITKCFGSRARPRLATDWEQLAGTYRDNEFFLVKLHGDAEQRDSLVLTPADYSRVLQQNAPFHRFVMSLYASKSFLFIGSSRRSIDQFLSELSLEESRQTHYALVPYERGFSAHQRVFDSKYRVKLLGYEPTVEHLEAIEFVDNLKKRVAEVKDTLPELTEDRLPWLQRVELKNIGPFEKLELDLKPSWNILLGDNGCGKSTILRAIALGLCGPDSRVAALGGNLLRFKQKKGSVALTIDGETYKTVLKRESGRVRVESPKRYTPLESGDWLALGFPALRGISKRDPTEPSIEVETRAPVADDLLPLLSGEVDTRLDDFKQWIYNAYHRSSSGGQEELDKIFSFLESVVPGINLSFAGIDKETLKILVRTDDGDVPIDQLSQGTASIISVAGNLLQRLMAVFKDRSDHTRQPALAIVDEIGSHMHPSWQYSLASLMERNFENLQIIGATHSPLVLGSIEDGTIFRMKRADGGGIDVQPTEKPLYGWLAEDIYEFMGLEETRAEGFRVRLNTFKQLDEMRVNGSATQNQLDQLDQIRKDLGSLPGEDPVSLTLELDNLAELLIKDAPVAATADVEGKA